jgi:hypothetical protein
MTGWALEDEQLTALVNVRPAAAKGMLPALAMTMAVPVIVDVAVTAQVPAADVVQPALSPKETEAASEANDTTTPERGALSAFRAVTVSVDVVEPSAGTASGVAVRDDVAEDGVLEMGPASKSTKGPASGTSRTGGACCCGLQVPQKTHQS